MCALLPAVRGTDNHNAVGRYLQAYCALPPTGELIASRLRRKAKPGSDMGLWRDFPTLGR
jgi:hypothetical protein